MKFSKFVKSLAPDGGAIYEYMDERWLASPSALAFKSKLGSFTSS